MWNQGFRYRERIGPRFAGSPVSVYLAARHDHTSEAGWRERIFRGEVLLDGEPTASGVRLREGQELVWERPPWREPTAPLDYTVLSEDASLVAVDKPTGLPTLAGGGFLEHTLVFQVRRRYPEASPVHRLGRWTSGVVLFARTRGSRSRLCRGFRDRRIEKRYFALGSGSPPRDRWVVETPIGKRPHPLLGFVYAAGTENNGNGEGGTVFSARTEIEVLESFPGPVFLARATIRTGRPHQVRIHMAASGHPLAGDPLYPPGGVPSPETTALPGDPGYRLHASEIVFSHPGDGRRMRITAPAPDWVG